MPKEPVLVFGSNLAGRHVGNTALLARKKYGAVQGVPVGRTGNAYAIPTRDRRLEPLPLHVIEKYVQDFIRYAKANPETMFLVTRVGCVNTGYNDGDIAPMFKDAPDNCHLPAEWR